MTLTSIAVILGLWIAGGLLVGWGFGKIADATLQDGPGE